MNAFFHDRADAGRQLAARMSHYEKCFQLLVLALPRGGVPVASVVASRLDAPMDVLVVRKLGVPCQPELAMGAIAPGGVCVLDEDVVDRLEIGGDVVGMVRRLEELELERRERVYREGRPALDVTGMTVILVADGIATGARCHAAIRYLKQQQARSIVVASPVISVEAFRKLRTLVDDIVTVALPTVLRSVGSWYKNFGQITDEEVQACLHTMNSVHAAPELARE